MSKHQTLDYKVKCELILPVLGVVNGKDDPRVEVILFEGRQHGELTLASQFLDHQL